MRSFRICFFLLILAAAFAFSPFAVLAEPIRGQCVILVDAKSGKVLYEQRADTRIPPASLTKVLSMYVALNAVSSGKKSLQHKITVSRAAAETRGSRLGLRAGDKVTLDKLLYGMAVASGNDASVAVAEYVAGSQAAFVRRMNSLAKRIGMSRSTFVNVHGLPVKGQFTTARDMMKMARAYEAHYPSARRYHLEPFVTYRGKTEPNHNPLSSWYPGITGLKTGWINDSGYNIIATASRGGRRLIAVILGAPNTRVRAAEAGRLLNAGFAALSRRGGSVAAELGVSARQVKNLKRSPSYAQPPRLDAGKKKAAKDSRKNKKIRAGKKQPPVKVGKEIPPKKKGGGAKMKATENKKAPQNVRRSQAKGQESARVRQSPRKQMSPSRQARAEKSKKR